MEATIRIDYVTYKLQYSIDRTAFGYTVDRQLGATSPRILDHTELLGEFRLNEGQPLFGGSTLVSLHFLHTFSLSETGYMDRQDQWSEDYSRCLRGGSWLDGNDGTIGRLEERNIS